MLKVNGNRVQDVPIEVRDVEEFARIAERALECRVKRARKDGVAKIKARTKRYLYTLKVKEDELDDVLSKIKCKKVVDLDKGEVKES